MLQYHIHINNQVASRNGVPHVSLHGKDGISAEDFYRGLSAAYPKFFKMDLLCKWAWVGAEYLLSAENGFVYEGMDKNKIAVVLFTKNGCLEVDKRYQDTLTNIASPALFVYTLPNIMLGEICIRHGFKGEQLCMVQEEFDEQEMQFWVDDLLKNKKMDACLHGWVDATGSDKEVKMFWTVRQ